MGWGDKGLKNKNYNIRGARQQAKHFTHIISCGLQIIPWERLLITPAKTRAPAGPTAEHGGASAVPGRVCLITTWHPNQTFGSYGPVRTI